MKTKCLLTDWGLSQTIHIILAIMHFKEYKNLQKYGPNIKFFHILKQLQLFIIKVFNNLPQSLKKLTRNSKQFKIALKHYLHTHSFYSIDEYLNVNK
jgi:hypothetical protein